jgi:hypothetical protein
MASPLYNGMETNSNVLRCLLGSNLALNLFCFLGSFDLDLAGFG